MLDRDGNRIDRRNPQDIFVPLYNKQIPPGAGQVVHFGLEVPESQTGPITLEAKVNYRKFDRKYIDYIFGEGQGARAPRGRHGPDAVQLPVEGGPTVEERAIADRARSGSAGMITASACCWKVARKGGQKGELKQAEEVFLKVAELGHADGWVNLARVYQKEGRIPDALSALEKAAKHKKPAAPWVINWLTGQINVRNGHLDEAIQSYEAVLNTKIPERKIRLQPRFRGDQ